MNMKNIPRLFANKKCVSNIEIVKLDKKLENKKNFNSQEIILIIFDFNVRNQLKIVVKKVFLCLYVWAMPEVAHTRHNDE